MKDLFGRDQDRSTGMAMSRRRALMALGAMGACAAGLVLIPHYRRLIAPSRVVDMAAVARAMLPFSRDERAALGKAVRAREPMRAYARAVAGCLGALVIVRDEDLLGPRDIDRLLGPLSTASRADFANGRVLMIDRWYLSRTQCDVLAMAAVAPAAPAKHTGAAS